MLTVSLDRRTACGPQTKRWPNSQVSAHIKHTRRTTSCSRLSWATSSMYFGCVPGVDANLHSRRMSGTPIRNGGRHSDSEGGGSVGAVNTNCMCEEYGRGKYVETSTRCKHPPAQKVNVHVTDRCVSDQWHAGVKNNCTTTDCALRGGKHGDDLVSRTQFLEDWWL